MGTKLSFKSDKYRRNRGGHSRWLLLHCEKCGNSIAIYQKDGPGILKRLYIDRIFAPEGLKDKRNKNLACKRCKTVLGIQNVWEKENRLVYRLFSGAIGKRIVKGDKFPKVNF